jgi:hypothetical protein
MATVGGIPIPDPAKGIEALERDLKIVLGERDVGSVGWARPDTLTLLVPLFAATSADFYLLRLNFVCYPDWPPSAQFVNPQSLRYDGVVDKKWLPKIEGTNEIAIHPEYDNGGKKIQLICCSYTLEFYEVRHGVEERHLWDSKVHTFNATLGAIRRCLVSAFYKGPQEARA